MESKNLQLQLVMKVKGQPNSGGWQPLMTSKNLPPKKVKPLSIGNKHFVLFRTASGKLSLLDAFCPHLGANLGYGGVVKGEHIQCPFHGVPFNSKGEGQVKPKNCKKASLNISSWEIKEEKGTIFCRENQKEINLQNRYPFCIFPKSWFAACLSKEIGNLQNKGLTLMGKETLITRDQKGNLSVLPESFKDIREVDGIIYILYNETDEPIEWTIPPLDVENWTSPIIQDFKIKAHPQEIYENSVDTTHFFHVHKYSSVEVLSPLKFNGHHMNISYKIKRSEGLFGRPDRKKMEFQIDIDTFGLGYSKVEVTIPKYNLKVRQILVATPIDGQVSAVKAITMVKEFEEAKGILKYVFPKPFRIFIAKVLCFLAARGFRKDFNPDIQIWENKIFLDNPSLLRNDGPIGEFRKWAGQFS